MSYRIQPESVTRADVTEPSKFSVVFHNDDFTTMEFVVGVLMKVFQKSEQEAADIMMRVHSEGRGVAGTYAFDIAVTKKVKTEQLAAVQGFPLRLTIDEVV